MNALTAAASSSSARFIAGPELGLWTRWVAPAPAPATTSTRAPGVGVVMLVVILLVTASAARAQQTRWTLTTADFATSTVELRSLDDQGLVVRMLPDGVTQQIPMQQFLRIECPPAATSSAPAAFTLYLAGSDRLRGEPISIADDTLTWNSPLLGQCVYPLRAVRAIVRTGTPPPSSRPDSVSRQEDMATLANGDSVRGIVTAMSRASGITFQTGAANPVSVPLDAMTGLYFAATPEIADTTQPSATVQSVFQLRLADGSVVTARSLKQDDGTVHLTTGDRGAAHDLPLAMLSAVEQVNGPVVFLSSIPPAENVQVPYFSGDPAYPARMDQSVTGGPIRAGRREYARGIGVHAYARLVYDLTPWSSRYVTFRTQYALDTAQTSGLYASVTVRIKLDGRTVYEQADVDTAALSPVLTFPLDGARRLTLEVDYGRNFDVQDRFNWIQPALTQAVSQAPSTQP